MGIKRLRKQDIIHTIMDFIGLKQMRNYIIITFTILLAISCTRDTFNEDRTSVDVPEGMALVPLHTNAKDYQTPVSRSTANEGLSSTESPWVFVFIGSDDNAVFFEAKKSIVVGASNDPYVILTRQNESVRIVIVANAPSTFFNGTENVDFTTENLNNILSGKTIVEALNNYLNSPKVTTTDLSTILYDDSYLPMSEIHDELTNGIDENSSIGKPSEKVALKRIVAKVTVTNSAPGFSLTGASVVRARNYGRLYQQPTAALLPPATNADLFNYITPTKDIVAPAVNNTTQATPIYIYESPKEDQTSVIVKGTYNEVQGFYRLIFKSKNETGNPVMDIERNKLYVFTITSINATGFSTINEAIASPPVNDLINYSIAVVDMDSHDIIDNGLYYLGVSNTDLHIYSDSQENNITAVTISTNATDDALGFGAMKYYSLSGSGISTPGGIFDAPLNLSPDGTTPGITEIKINTTADFVSGSIKIQLGNIIKEINIIRSGGELDFIDTILDPSGNGSATPEFSSASVDPASNSWLSLALSTNGTNNVGSDYVQPTPNSFSPIYIRAAANYGDGAAPRPATVYLSRKTEGRIKLYIKQSALNTAAIVSTHIPNSYVGAFYRATQTDERRITIPTVGTTPANAVGTWYALVVAGQDWIKLDTEAFGSNGGNVSTLASTAVKGTASTASPIRFRIGASSPHPDSNNAGINGTATPRYGLVIVAYGTPLKSHPIYVRQGEAASAIIGSAKWSPYNITDPTQSATFTTLPVRGGAMTAYPTQAGYFFQWNKLVAYNPTVANNPNGGAGNTAWSDTREVCPPGYIHPTSNDFETSIAQSSKVGTAFWPGAWGYYADGFFDRGTIISSVIGDANSTVSTGGTVAYRGRMFFNSATNASIFFPAAGDRASDNGNITGAGNIGYSWSKTILATNSSNATILLINSALAIANSGVNTATYSSVRCIRE